MKNNGRLTLADFKAKADQANLVESLEAIQGGNLSDCHGFFGAVGKAFRAVHDNIMSGKI